VSEETENAWRDGKRIAFDALRVEMLAFAEAQQMKCADAEHYPNLVAEINMHFDAVERALGIEGVKLFAWRESA
jgi:hypothetical protein